MHPFEAELSSVDRDDFFTGQRASLVRRHAGHDVSNRAVVFQHQPDRRGKAPHLPVQAYFCPSTVHPTWEKFAEIMHDVEKDHKVPENAAGLSEEEIESVDSEHPVLVAKVDCVQHASLCAQEGIMAYPSLILYVNGGRALVSEHLTLSCPWA